MYLQHASMSNIAIVVDSTVDATDEMVKALGLNVVNAYVSFENKMFTKDDMSDEEFHELLSTATKKNWPSTSQPSAQDMLDVFEKLKDQGVTQVLGIFVSLELSGTLNSANVASSMIDGLEIEIVDSRSVSSQLMTTVDYAKKLLDGGSSLGDTADTLREFVKGLNSHISLQTMDNLRRGGRIGGIKYGLGKWLNIKPVLQLNNGKLESFDKGKGVEQSREKAYMHTFDEFTADDEFTCFIGHTLIPDVAADFKARVEKEFPKAKVSILKIGFAVAVHAGKEAIIFTAAKY